MILGNRINITDVLNDCAFEAVAQWIGSSNVIRNQKINEFELNNYNKVNQSYAHIKKQLDFLKSIPPQLLRNSASDVYTDVNAFKKGLRGKPKIKNKYKKRKCIVTNELFDVIPLKENENKSKIIVYNHGKLNKKALFFVIVDFKYDSIQNQIILTRQKDKIFLSFSYDDGVKQQTNNEMLNDLSHLSEAELREHSIGFDSGVKTAIYGSNGFQMTYSIEQRNRMLALDKKRVKKQRYAEKQRKRYLRKNKKHTSCELTKRQIKIKKQIAKAHHKTKMIRDNFAHHISKEMVKQTPKLCILEDLKLLNMTKKPKPKPKANGGGYETNGRRAKASLNKALLNMAIGKIHTYTKYKLNKEGKAYYEVNPYNTSRVCFDCKGLNTERPSQAVFICHDCKKESHADFNAGNNIQYKGINDILTQPMSPKTKKKIVARRKKLSQTDEPRLTIKKRLEIRKFHNEAELSLDDVYIGFIQFDSSKRTIKSS